MSEVLDKLVVGVLLAVVTAIVGLFVRVRQLEGKRSAADVRLDHLEKRPTGSDQVKRLEERIDEHHEAFREFQIEAERRYVSRDDWVPVMSQMVGKLEAQGEAIARIDEFIRMRGCSHDQ